MPPFVKILSSFANAPITVYKSKDVPKLVLVLETNKWLAIILKALNLY